ncbi:hypothetical protein IKF15_00070 [Candidatus Saccharibacteria bacterium]|nr:hypothetical protein [Candidatus Saccharibacteria bacterium]
MAKQKSIIKITGVVDGKSFFYSKLGGYQLRKINPNMSDRVKTEPAFANTRLAAQEFKGAASTASAIVRGVTSRWRFFSTPKLVGDLTKFIIAQNPSDPSHPWGQRTLTQNVLGNVQNYYNSRQKVQMPSFIQQYFDEKVTYQASGSQLVLSTPLTMTLDDQQHLLSQGATHIRMEVWGYEVVFSHYDSILKQWIPALSRLSSIRATSSTLSLINNEDLIIFPASTPVIEFNPTNQADRMSGVLVTYFPLKRVEGWYHTLQRLCSVYWKSV